VSVNPTDPMIGRLLDGRYQVRSRIARGGMATVYLATDLRLERRVAIKIMHGHLLDDAQFRERFIQEARSAARLAHPNVVNVFDQGQDTDMAYLVMEYLPGITLRDLLTEHRVLTAEQTFDIMEAVLGGLAAAHKAGIVHRDLKPENVLLADDGRIKIGDFGLARAASANTATGAALLGTIAYLSPELVTRGVADARSDIYAAGIMMFEMLVGEQPYKGDQPMQIAYQHANESVPAPSSKNPRVPAELDEIVQWATAREPDNRPKDARAMLDQVYEIHDALRPTFANATSSQRTVVLPSASRAPAAAQPSIPPASATAETQVLGGRPPAPPRPSSATAPPADRTGRRKAWFIVLAIIVALVAGGTGWYFLFGPGSQVSVPDVAGLSAAEATTVLQEHGFTVNPTPGATDSPTVAVDAVAQTDPPIGERVDKGTEITLLLSTGPKPITVPAFAGMTEAEAIAAIEAAPFTLVEPVLYQFSTDVSEGIVVDVLGADRATSILAAGTYGEDQQVTLIISAGPLPDVAGKSVDEAKQILSGVDLSVQDDVQEEFHNDIPAGAVIGIDAGSGPIRRGDSVTLIVSRGPDLVTVPAGLVGMTLSDAIAAVEAAGLVADPQTNIPQVFWGLPGAEVDSASPASGEQAIRGSTVVLVAEA
jgi:beta-lactam-binding protein with PASTA domain/tRNA A-37 threonylcarbamoyl transferase component Bud32